MVTQVLLLLMSGVCFQRMHRGVGFSSSQGGVNFVLSRGLLKCDAFLCACKQSLMVGELVKCGTFVDGVNH